MKTYTGKKRPLTDIKSRFRDKKRTHTDKKSGCWDKNNAYGCKKAGFEIKKSSYRQKERKNACGLHQKQRVFPTPKQRSRM